MILDSQPFNKAKSAPEAMQAPPSYDAVILNVDGSIPFVSDDEKARIVTETAPSPSSPRPTPPPPIFHAAESGTSSRTSPPPTHTSSPLPQSAPGPKIYTYVNPKTGEHVVSLLPPDHPQMVCLQSGGHELTSKYGWLGIFCAVVLFPVGIGCCILDRRTKCKRCKIILDEGLCA